MRAVTLVGNLTTDPTWYKARRRSQNGRATFAIAVNDYRGPDADEEDEVANFFFVTAFGSLGENLVDSLSKGDRVVVAGKIGSYDAIVYDEDGEEVERTMLNITADAVGPDLRFATAEISRVRRTKSRTQAKRRDEDADDDFDEEDIDDDFDEDAEEETPKKSKVKSKAKRSTAKKKSSTKRSKARTSEDDSDDDDEEEF